jgi:hypothetical protein
MPPRNFKRLAVVERNDVATAHRFPDRGNGVQVGSFWPVNGAEPRLCGADLPA